MPKKPVKKKPNKKTAVATTRQSNKQDLVAPSKVTASMLQQDAGAGQENVTQDDLAIPRLAILQQLSPQCQKTSSDYIEDAEPGYIFNSVTEDMYDGAEGLNIVIVTYKRNYIEWITRAKGGGFVANHGSDPAILKSCHKKDGEFGQYTVEGNEVVPTAEYFAFILDDDEPGKIIPVLISMSKMQLGKARKLNTMINQYRADSEMDGQKFTPASFFHVWKFTVVPENNDKGSWFGWRITRHKDLLSIPGGSEVYLEARSFAVKAEKGEVKAHDPQTAETVPESAGSDAPM